MKLSLIFASLVVGTVVLVGCTANSAEEMATDDAALTTAMVGDFHLKPRSLDEHFLFDGAPAELAVVKNGDDCHYQALQATGGCSADWHCSINELLSNRHSKKVEGRCTMDQGVLTLHASEGETALRMSSATVNGQRGYVLTSVSGAKLNRGGPSAFFVETSRDPDEAFKRSYVAGGLEALTKHFEPNDPALSEPVRAGVARLVQELSEPIDEISREVDDTYMVFATPFETTPLAYAVFSSHSGNHCGGYQVFAVNASGTRLRTELSDGDCGL